MGALKGCRREIGGRKPAEGGSQVGVPRAGSRRPEKKAARRERGRSVGAEKRRWVLRAYLGLGAGDRRGRLLSEAAYAAARAGERRCGGRGGG